MILGPSSASTTTATVTQPPQTQTTTATVTQPPQTQTTTATVTQPPQTQTTTATVTQPPQTQTTTATVTQPPQTVTQTSTTTITGATTQSSQSTSNTSSTSASSSTTASGAIANVNQLQILVPVYFYYPSQPKSPNVLFKKSDGTVIALSLLCTHECCTSQFEDSTGAYIVPLPRVRIRQLGKHTGGAGTPAASSNRANHR